MHKLILKTALITLASVLALALLLFGVFSLFVPSVMVSLTDKLGMDGACARYSCAVYDKSGEVGDLAMAVERSYNAQRYEDAAAYGAELLARDDFSDYCTARDGAQNGLTSSYAQYAAGITSVSQYLAGDGDAAVRTAFSACGNAFAAGNAAVYLIDAALGEQGDAAMCGVLLTKLQELSAQLSPSQAEDAARLSVWLRPLEEAAAA